MENSVIFNTSKNDNYLEETHSSFDSPLFWLSQSVSTTDSPISPSNSSKTDSDAFCKWVLYWEFQGSRVRLWDVIILIPTFLFMMTLALRLNRARHKFRATNSAANYLSFYMLVLVNTFVSLVRCVVSMTINAALPAGSTTDKVLWVVVRFFLLSTEMSVVIFALAFGHLDSKSSSRYVLAVTSIISLIYSVSQGTLEIISPDENFYVPSKDYNIFAHGGMLFWFTSSIVFALLYLAIFILPWTKMRDRLSLPAKPSFYYYILFLASLNVVQATGSGMLYYRQLSGLCMVDVTTYIYFTLFTPLVYWTFLSEFLSISQPSISFSYKAQVDEILEDDSVSLPHQLSCSSLKTDSDYIYQSNMLYDNTQFESNGTPINPLYNHSLQSPDSVNVYYDHLSRSNSVNSDPGPSQRSGKQFKPSRLLEEQQ